MAPTTPSTSSSASPSPAAAAKTSSPSSSTRRSPRDDGMYCYLNAVAQNGSGAERAMAEARLQLEQRVDDGTMEVGDSCNKTRLVQRVGSGSFGDVYLGLTDTNAEVAVKVELSSCPSSSRCLLYEGDVYRKLSGCPGIANVRWFGMHGSDYSVLVMDLLGPTLYSVWSQLGQKFSMRTLLTIVDQSIEIISHVHSRGFVHRDLSPSNFMLGPSKDRIYLIDFGQSKKPVMKLVPASRNRFSFARPIVGTPRFTSSFAHAGCEPSYRDDMESLGFLWVYLAKGRLPWQGITDCAGPAKIGRIGQLKMTTPVEELCSGLPQEFAAFITYARSLRPYDMPDHSSARAMFRSLAEKLCPDDESPLDWMGLDLDAADAGSSKDSNPTRSDSEEDVALVTRLSK